jgi:hypothetical protein
MLRVGGGSLFSRHAVPLVHVDQVFEHARHLGLAAGGASQQLVQDVGVGNVGAAVAQKYFIGRVFFFLTAAFGFRECALAWLTNWDNNLTSWDTDQLPEFGS